MLRRNRRAIAIGFDAERPEVLPAETPRALEKRFDVGAELERDHASPTS